MANESYYFIVSFLTLCALIIISRLSSLINNQHVEVQRQVKPSSVKGSPIPTTSNNLDYGIAELATNVIPIVQDMTLVELSSNNSTLQSEIINITHIQSKSMIVINFIKDDNTTTTIRKCNQPVVRGRLSGSSLSIIEKWEISQDHDKLVGRYHVPFSGKHYIEIIGIMCNDIDFDEDFIQLCLIDPEFHRITADGAFINVTLSSSSSLSEDQRKLDNNDFNSDSRLGYWFEQATNKGSHNTDNRIQKPLYTRYQPQGCRDHNLVAATTTSQQHQHCQQATDITRFDRYYFQFIKTGDSIMDNFDKHNLKKEHHVVCALGYSHSKYLTQFMTQMISWHNVENVTIRWVRARYPTDITSEFVSNDLYNANCTKVVVGLGENSIEESSILCFLF